MSVLDAELAILDEIDSGLDIDALRDVANAVNGLKREETATLMVTHYKVCVVSPSVCTLRCVLPPQPFLCTLLCPATKAMTT